MHNEVVVWDRIVRRKEDARLRIADQNNKYPFKDYSRKFSCVRRFLVCRVVLMRHLQERIRCGIHDAVQHHAARGHPQVRRGRHYLCETAIPGEGGENVVAIVIDVRGLPSNLVFCVREVFKDQTVTRIWGVTYGGQGRLAHETQ